MNSIQLHEVKHPDKLAQARYERLIGIDAQKNEFLDHLYRIFDPARLSRWKEKHHPKGLPAFKRIEERPPLVILAGEVGCGKTALANSIGSAVATALDKRVVSLESPSDIRGSVLVGQLSERITAVFNETRVKVGKGLGILIIDEGDDLGTSRAQMQAHHEDRAGVNVLIKEIDRVAREGATIAVVLITNRLKALDPAIIRRAHVIRFNRPGLNERRALFNQILDGVEQKASDVEDLVKVTERKPPFSYSDLVERGVDAALMTSLRADQPLTVAMLKDVLRNLEPTPLIEEPET